MDFLQQIPASYGRYIKDNPTTNPNVTFHMPDEGWTDQNIA